MGNFGERAGTRSQDPLRKILTDRYFQPLDCRHKSGLKENEVTFVKQRVEKHVAPEIAEAKEATLPGDERGRTWLAGCLTARGLILQGQAAA
jgi:hypothetical protein